MAVAILVVSATAVSLVITALYSGRTEVRFAVRLFTDGSTGKSGIPLRVEAYDPGERKQLTLESCGTENDGENISVKALPDKSCFLFLPETARERSMNLILVSESESRSLKIPVVKKMSDQKISRAFLIPLSNELRAGPATQLGLGTRGSDLEHKDSGALDLLKVIPYPEQGRLASNLSNRVWLWARGCGNKGIAGETKAEIHISVETSGGNQILVTDAEGMSEYRFDPTIGATWMKLKCDEWSGGVDLLDKPQGIAVSPKGIFLRPRDEAVMDMISLFPEKSYVMDVFRNCEWYDSRSFASGDSGVKVGYTLPDVGGVYSFEFYSNVNLPGSERARAIIFASGSGGRDEFAKFVGSVQGDLDGEPIFGQVKKMITKDSPIIGNRLAEAFVSRIDMKCGPPPLILDSRDDDMNAFLKEREGAKNAAHALLYSALFVSIAGIGFIMFTRLKSVSRAEEVLKDQHSHIVLQHLSAAAIAAVAFGFLLYMLEIWWGM